MADLQRDRCWDNRLYAACRDLSPMDLYPDNRYGRRYTKDEFAAVVAARPELIAVRRQRSQEFTIPARGVREVA